MRLREKIVEQESEHHKLVEENNQLRTEKEIMVSEYPKVLESSGL